ncbi:helix-turn-helix domain-containing protein [Paracoccus caeni]|uniref:Helix-turn-helix domain-containing protein n=1 Tax=Paracoccus caeni TaxID=657651 RepID=A0A934W1A6_9RHOB|nr:helix-turn-helix domain-containing protein [Paracoccus caeni]
MSGPSDPDGEADLPDDAQLYLRHIEKGLSIRALAREADCHASTILRRIRRFEARRDDPLIDGAVAAVIDRRRAFDERQALRILRRLAEPGAIMATSEVMEKAIVTRNDIRTAILDRHLAEAMALRGWVIHIPDNRRLRRYVIAPAGREMLRSIIGRKRKALPLAADFSDASPVGDQLADDQPNGFADQHRVWQAKVMKDPEDGRRRTMRVNIAESPLLLLSRRRDSSGQTFLTPGMVTAGERLREDFELAQMGPRVTQNWDGFLTSGIDKRRAGDGIHVGSDSARDRVAAALRDLGPGMGDIVLRVCCFLEGIEQTERRLGWSARSGKIVLRLALMRLERFYQNAYGSGARLIG